MYLFIKSNQLNYFPINSLIRQVLFAFYLALVLLSITAKILCLVLRYYLYLAVYLFVWILCVYSILSPQSFQVLAYDSSIDYLKNWFSNCLFSHFGPPMVRQQVPQILLFGLSVCVCVYFCVSVCVSVCILYVTVLITQTCRSIFRLHLFTA